MKMTMTVTDTAMHMGMGMDEMAVDIVNMIVGTGAPMGSSRTMVVVMLVNTPIAAIMDVVTVTKAVKSLAKKVNNNKIRN